VSIVVQPPTITGNDRLVRGGYLLCRLDKTDQCLDAIEVSVARHERSDIQCEEYMSDAIGPGKVLID
jgi:hypothetical protein